MSTKQEVLAEFDRINAYYQRALRNQSLDKPRLQRIRSDIDVLNKKISSSPVELNEVFSSSQALTQRLQELIGVPKTLTQDKVESTSAESLIQTGLTANKPTNEIKPEEEQDFVLPEKEEDLFLDNSQPTQIDTQNTISNNERHLDDELSLEDELGLEENTLNTESPFSDSKISDTNNDIFLDDELHLDNDEDLALDQAKSKLSTETSTDDTEDILQLDDPFQNDEPILIHSDQNNKTDLDNTTQEVPSDSLIVMDDLDTEKEHHSSLIKDHGPEQKLEVFEVPESLELGEEIHEAQDETLNLDDPEDEETAPENEVFVNFNDDHGRENNPESLRNASIDDEQVEFIEKQITSQVDEPKRTTQSPKAQSKENRLDALVTELQESPTNTRKSDASAQANSAFNPTASNAQNAHKKNILDSINGLLRRYIAWILRSLALFVIILILDFTGILDLGYRRCVEQVQVLINAIDDFQNFK